MEICENALWKFVSLDACQSVFICGNVHMEVCLPTCVSENASVCRSMYKRVCV